MHPTNKVLKVSLQIIEYWYLKVVYRAHISIKLLSSFLWWWGAVGGKVQVLVVVMVEGSALWCSRLADISAWSGSCWHCAAISSIQGGLLPFSLLESLLEVLCWVGAWTSHTSLQGKRYTWIKLVLTLVLYTISIKVLVMTGTVEWCHGYSERINKTKKTKQQQHSTKSITFKTSL